MEGVVPSRPNTVVAIEIAPVPSNRDRLEVAPGQDVELVGSLSPQSDEHADQVRIWRLSRSTDNLFLAVEPDLGEDTGIKLPGPSSDGLHLNRLVPTAPV